MDRNGDGIITQAEWRGSARSFRNLDRNGDGRLSFGEQREAINEEIDQTRPEFDDWTAEGFRYVDRNRDGRISRAEWFYDLASFRRADRNGDNVLTRAEFLATDDFGPTEPRREDRFETLDTNNNGRIERGEWLGRIERFEALDRNNDGIVSRAEMLNNQDDAESRLFADADDNSDNRLSQREWQWAQRVFTQQDVNRDGYVSREEFWSPGDVSATGTSGYADNRVVNSPVVVQVSSTERWVDTGLDTRAGDLLRITSSGTVRLSASWNDQASPAGANRRAEQAPLPFHPAGALIARIANGTPFFVGDGTNIERVSAAGRLYLSVNDDHLGDNSGSFRVTIVIRPQ
jgi:Ca2+-binding EF-hand superfamily protein